LYAYETRSGHADCIDASYLRALYGFIDSLADVVVADLCKERGLSFSGPRRKFDEPKVDLTEFSERYLLPEFDIDTVVPTAGKSKQSYRMTGKIGNSRRGR
jgi:hypothetical protein